MAGGLANFKGKMAAPFKKGGGRKKKVPTGGGKKRSLPAAFRKRMGRG